MKQMHLLLFPLIIAASLNCMEESKQEWEIIKTFEHIDQVRAVDLSRHTNILATTSGDFKSHLFKLDSNTEFASFDNHNQITRAISIRGEEIAMGSNDGMVYIANFANKPRVTTGFPNKNQDKKMISAIKFNYNDNLAVAADHTVRLFDSKKRDKLMSFHHEDEPISICFDSDIMITASFNKVRTFDIRTKEKIKHFCFRRHKGHIASVLVNFNNQIVTVETPGDTIQMYNYTTNTITDTKIPVTMNTGERLYNGESISAICLHPGGKQLALGTYCKALVFAQNDKK